MFLSLSMTPFLTASHFVSLTWGNSIRCDSGVVFFCMSLFQLNRFDFDFLQLSSRFIGPEDTYKLRVYLYMSNEITMLLSIG